MEYVNKKGVKAINATHPKSKIKQNGVLDVESGDVTFSDGFKINKNKLKDLNYLDVIYKD